MGKFRIRIKPSWFSEEFIVLRYSTNGVFWRSVKTCEWNVLDDWHYMVTLTVHFTNAESLLEKFSTLEKIKTYEAEQKAVAERYNAATLKRRAEQEKLRKDIYNRFS